MKKRSDDPPVKLLGATVRDQTIELGHRSLMDFIGGGSILENCFLDIKGAGFMLMDATLRNCRMKVRRRLSNVRLLNMTFEKCVFEGSFSGCRFGYRRGESKNRKASYRDCDFSKARLDLCDFFEGDIASVNWPSWPHLIVLDPGKHKKDWLDIPFPSGFASTQSVVGLEPLPGEEHDPTIDDEPRAITVYLPEHDLDPEFTWPLIQDKDYIVFASRSDKPRASAEIAQATARANREQRKHREEEVKPVKIWNLLHNGVIERVTKQAKDRYRIDVDVSYLRKKIADAPSRVIVELSGCSELSLSSGQEPTSIPSGEFRIASAKIDGDRIVVKSRKKGIGPLQLQPDIVRLFDSDGRSLDVDTLDGWVFQYWIT